MLSTSLVCRSGQKVVVYSLATGSNDEVIGQQQNDKRRSDESIQCFLMPTPAGGGAVVWMDG
jgi:hypothetical protein